MEELHLIILWSKALYKREEILKDLNNKFDVINIYNVTWSEENFAKNLSRLFGEKSLKDKDINSRYGKDAFCCIVLKDLNPKYESRNSDGGSKVVNINLFDAEQKYKSWTGGGDKVFATSNIQETKIKLALLFGINYDDLIVSNTETNIEINVTDDIVGANGWKSFDELFNIMNLTTNYVVLRNFDNLEDQLTSKHPDVDILVENKKLVVDILNGVKTNKIPFGVQYNVIIDNKDINFDLRHVGDNYYDRFWEMDIIETKVLNKKGFYTPNDIHYFYSLIYHALIHKRSVSKDYNEKFLEIARDNTFELTASQLTTYELLNTLIRFMNLKRYKFIEPVDLSVFYNKNLIEKKTLTFISKERTKRNKQTAFKNFKKYIIKRLLKLNQFRKGL